jgi:hypothetical protein
LSVFSTTLPSFDPLTRIVFLRERDLGVLVAVEAAVHAAAGVEQVDREVAVEVRSRAVAAVACVVRDVGLDHAFLERRGDLLALAAVEAVDQPYHHVDLARRPGRWPIRQRILAHEEVTDTTRCAAGLLVEPGSGPGVEHEAVRQQRVHEVPERRLVGTVLIEAERDGHVEDAILEHLAKPELVLPGLGSTSGRWLRGLELAKAGRGVHRAPRIGAERLDQAGLCARTEVAIGGERVQAEAAQLLLDRHDLRPCPAGQRLVRRCRGARRARVELRAVPRRCGCRARGREHRECHKDLDLFRRSVHADRWQATAVAGLRRGACHNLSQRWRLT